jgi:hypothetical protein
MQYFFPSAKPIGIAAVVSCSVLLNSAVHAETVQVKHRGVVDLKPFKCAEVTRSSFVHRVYFDHANNYMPINLGGIYYHYCEIDDATVSSLLIADSMGSFYNSKVKGPFDGNVPLNVEIEERRCSP